MNKWFDVPFTGKYSVYAESKEEALLKVKQGKCGLTEVNIDEDNVHEEE